MTDKYAELRRLAEAASEIESWYEHQDFHPGQVTDLELDLVSALDRDFIIKAAPRTILSLLDELEACRAAIKPFAEYGALNSPRLAIGCSLGSAEITSEDWKRAAAMQEQKP